MLCDRLLTTEVIMKWVSILKANAYNFKFECILWIVSSYLEKLTMKINACNLKVDWVS